MERIITYTIKEDYQNKKISEFLHNKGYSFQNLAVIKRMPRGVLVNGQDEHMNYRLNEQDVLTIHIRETGISKKIPPMELPFPIIYEDEDLVVVNKPCHMPTHPSMKHYENTLANAAAYYYAKQNKEFIFRCINRLDKDTTGLTILAKHLVSCGILYREMKERRISRVYTAIVVGEDLADQGTISLPIARKEGTVIERITDEEQGAPAVTHFEVLGRGNGLAEVKLKLDTGRTHQIRVHMKAIGHPLIGDFLYNPENTMMERQALHAGELSFIHPVTGEAVQFSVPLPDDMQNIIQKMKIK